MSILNLFWIVPIVASVAWVFGYKADHERVKAFIKRHIVDDDPYQDEGHSATRYAQDDYIDWSKIPKGPKWSTIDSDGTIWAWYGKPVISNNSDNIMGWWYDPNASLPIGSRLSLDAIIGPLPPWRESLRKRPV